MKRAFLILFILSLSFFCFAEDLEMSGFGKTLEEARNNAKENLSRYINGEFVSTKLETNSSNVTKVESGKDSLSVSQKSYLSENSFVSMGYLRSVEYLKEKQTKDGFEVTAIIKDNKINLALLQSEMHSLNNSIHSLNESLSGKENEIKKGILINLYSSLSEFENYKRTLIYMGHSDLIPDMNLNITATSVFSEYQNIILAEGYKLEELEQTLTDEAEKKKLQDELYQNRQEQRRLEKEKAQEMKAREESSRNLLIQKIHQAQALASVQINENKDSNSFSTILQETLKLKDTFYEACIQCNEIITEEFNEIDKALYADAAAVNNRPYRLAELDSEGNPLPQVYSVREDEIDYLYMSSLMHKAEVYKTIRESLFNSLEKKYNDFDSSVKKLDKSFDQEIKGNDRFSVSYDSVNTKWVVSIDLNKDFYVDNKLQFDLTYEELTGKKVQSPKYVGQKGYEQYLSFLDEVDYLDMLMKSFGDYFKVALSFSCRSKKNSENVLGYHNNNYSFSRIKLSSEALDFDKGIKISANYSSKDIFEVKIPEYLRSLEQKGFEYFK